MKVIIKAVAFSFILVNFFFRLINKATVRKKMAAVHFTTIPCELKDVRARCYCAFLLRTLFSRYARAISYIKRTHQAKYLTMCSADGRCVTLVREYFCWMHGDPHLFFGRSLPFLILSIVTKNKNILCMGSCNYFAFTIQMGLNCYINTGVRDLEVALFKANST